MQSPAVGSFQSAEASTEAQPASTAAASTTMPQEIAASPAGDERSPIALHPSAIAATTKPTAGTSSSRPKTGTTGQGDSANWSEGSVPVALRMKASTPSSTAR